MSRQSEHGLRDVVPYVDCRVDVSENYNLIINQKQYLESYASQKGCENCVHYTDDGWSGGNYEHL